MEERNKPAYKAVHPGEVLGAELKERGISQKVLARQIGMCASHLSELIHGKRSMTIAIADRLEEVLGIDSISWMNLQTQYNYDSSRERSTENVTVTLQVSVVDTSILPEIKQAIGMIRGVGKIAML